MANNENHKIYCKIEKAFSILLCLIIFTGIISEIIVHMGHAIFIIDDLRNYTLGILQIQAGVSTLAVALLALISGMIDDEAYGISITQYYMYIRPKIFKQYIVIIVVISLVFIGVIFELLSWYNIVFALFLCEWLLITISVIEILPIFKGLGHCKNEICEYLIYEITNNQNHDVIIQYMDSCATHPDSYDWDEEIIWIALKNLLDENTKESIAVLNTEWCKLLSSQLNHNESWVIKRGLNMLQETYHRIWAFIIGNKECCGDTFSPQIFDNLYEECRLALDHLSIEEMEECFIFDSFYECVARVDSWYLKGDAKKLINALRYIELFPQYTGHLLDKKLQSASRQLSDYDRCYWGEYLYNQSINSYNVPDSVAEIFLLHRLRVYLGYTISLIIDGEKDLFEKYYLESDAYSMTFNPYCTMYRLSVACYLYYLSEVESINLVPKKAKNLADSLLSTDKFKSQFTLVLERTKWKENIDLYISFFDKTLEEMLHHYELYRVGQIKTLVIDSTVDIFSIFIKSYIADYHRLGVEHRTDQNRLESHILSFLDGYQRDVTKETFRKLYNLFIVKHTNAEKIADDLFYQWEKRVLEQLKKGRIKHAIEANKEFLENNVEAIIREDTKEQLIGHFNDRFGSLIDKLLVGGNELTLNLISFVSDTDYFLSEKSLHELYTDLDTLLFEHIVDYLYKKKKITEYDRTEKNDFQFLDDMITDDVDVLVGSEFELIYKDFDNWKIFREFCDNRECIFLGGVQYALATHRGDIKFAVQDVGVSVHDSTIDKDNDVKFNDDTGMYNIRLINGIAGEFTKAEAEEYIKNQKKIVDISVKVRIKLDKENVGFLVENIFSD